MSITEMMKRIAALSGIPEIEAVAVARKLVDEGILPKSRGRAIVQADAGCASIALIAVAGSNRAPDAMFTVETFAYGTRDGKGCGPTAAGRLAEIIHSPAIAATVASVDLDRGRSTTIIRFNYGSEESFWTEVEELLSTGETKDVRSSTTSLLINRKAIIDGKLIRAIADEIANENRQS
jgi:hypothetical protein